MIKGNVSSTDWLSKENQQQSTTINSNDSAAVDWGQAQSSRPNGKIGFSNTLNWTPIWMLQPQMGWWHRFNADAAISNCGCASTLYYRLLLPFSSIIMTMLKFLFLLSHSGPAGWSQFWEPISNPKNSFKIILNIDVTWLLGYISTMYYQWRWVYWCAKVSCITLSEHILFLQHANVNLAKIWSQSW